jgi:hypothetical protein
VHDRLDPPGELRSRVQERDRALDFRRPDETDRPAWALDLALADEFREDTCDFENGG